MSTVTLKPPLFWRGHMSLPTSSGDLGETGFQLPVQSVRVLKPGLKPENKAPPIFTLAGGKAVKVNVHLGSQKGMNCTRRT
jgi:hypothetical protein